jgi:hypothetical protein
MGSDVLRNILSFGAHARIESALESYRKVQSDLKHAHGELEQQRVRTNRSLESLVSTKVAAVDRLANLKKISKNLSVRQRNLTQSTVGSVPLGSPLEDIESTLNAAEIAKSMAKGTTAGLSTALGAWALVGTLGTASTGTAIATLSGAAATNATLAWLGGGALAAGGGGMAAGAAVLGGIVILPALAIMGAFSHVAANKKIAKIEEASSNAVQAIATFQKTKLNLNALQRRSDELASTITRSCDVFNRQYASARKELYPWGFFSQCKRFFRRVICKPFFDDRDLNVIAPLLQMAATVADLIDTRLMDEEGRIL